MILHISFGFADLPDQKLDNFVERILDNLYTNPAYPAPPVLKPALEAAKTDFVQKLAKAATGGPADTAAKNEARQTLLGLLRQLAIYVQGACNNDKATALESGFEVASAERRREPLVKPGPLTLDNGGVGRLIGKVPAVKNCRMYEGRASADNGVTWLPSVFSGDSRHIIFAGLTPGTEYTCQVRALGGSTGQSEWSDPVKHRSL